MKYSHHVFPLFTFDIIKSRVKMRTAVTSACNILSTRDELQIKNVAQIGLMRTFFNLKKDNLAIPTVLNLGSPHKSDTP